MGRRFESCRAHHDFNTLQTYVSTTCVQLRPTFQSTCLTLSVSYQFCLAFCPCLVHQFPLHNAPGCGGLPAGFPPHRAASEEMSSEEVFIKQCFSSTGAIHSEGLR